MKIAGVRFYRLKSLVKEFGFLRMEKNILSRRVNINWFVFLNCFVKNSYSKEQEKAERPVMVQ